MNKTKNIYNFKSLQILKQIIKKEKKYKIQIISLESFNLFYEFLSTNSIEFHIMDHKSPLKSKLNIQTEYQNVDLNKIILYNNKRQSDFIQIVFELSNQEKEKLLGNFISVKKKISYLLNAFPYKNIDEICNMETGYSIDIPEIMKNSLDYTESVILLCLVRCSKLKDLITNIKQVDIKLNNVFMIKNKLESLTERKIISCARENYKITISHESLRKILERIDFNVDRI